jgi:hypothetical protein
MQEVPIICDGEAAAEGCPCVTAVERALEFSGGDHAHSGICAYHLNRLHLNKSEIEIEIEIEIGIYILHIPLIIEKRSMQYIEHLKEVFF